MMTFNHEVLIFNHTEFKKRKETGKIILELEIDPTSFVPSDEILIRGNTISVWFQLQPKVTEGWYYTCQFYDVQVNFVRKLKKSQYKGIDITSSGIYWAVILDDDTRFFISEESAHRFIDNMVG